MNPLKRIVKSTLNRDPIEEIFWGSPTADTYQKVLTNYRSLPFQMRQEIIARCLKKLAKVKEADLMIANLALIHKLMRMDFVCLPPKEPEIQQNAKKRQVAMAQKSFVKFYFKFLKLVQSQLPNKQTTIHQQIQFCSTAISKCIQTIKSSLFIQYCLLHSANQLTLRIALKQIFQDLRSGLQQCNQFIQTNARLIYQQHTETSLAINDIYQNLIYVSKDIHKISSLIKKAGLLIGLSVYKIDKELNLRIQMEMNVRKEERMKWRTEKRIGSRREIAEGNEKEERERRAARTMKHIEREDVGFTELDQDEILINQDQLL